MNTDFPQTGTDGKIHCEDEKDAKMIWGKREEGHGPKKMITDIEYL